MENRCRLSILLKPNAKRNAIAVNADESLAVAVTSPPVDGKANKQLIAMLAKQLRLPKSSIDIVAGKTFRKKILAIDGLDRKSAIAGLTHHIERK
jgi:uncharacterized protein (TIGR00251 family)